MRRSARQLEEPSGLGGLFREGLVLSGAAIVRNPMIAGGTTAFLVAMAFVSANAIWYQPHQHMGAFFATRAAVETPSPLPRPKPRPADLPQTGDTTILIEREAISAMPGADPQVRLVQEILHGLNLYAGSVDGLAGPQTAKAVENYQRLVGLQPTGKIDAGLLGQLGATSSTGSGEKADDDSLPEAFVPAPERPADPAAAISAPPLPRQRPDAEGQIVNVAARQPDPRIVRIQAGLKAFGNDGIELDGVVGARTRSAIREFQSLFGLPATGEPDAAIYAKMREIGLTD